MSDESPQRAPSGQVESLSPGECEAELRGLDGADELRCLEIYAGLARRAPDEALRQVLWQHRGWSWTLRQKLPALLAHLHDHGQWRSQAPERRASRRRRCILLLRRLCHDPDYDVRRAAYEALALAAPEAFAGLAQQGLQDPHTSVQECVLAAIEELKLEGFGGQVEGFLGHFDAGIREQALCTLCALQGEGPLQPAHEAAQSDDPARRLAAVEALSSHGGLEDLPILEALRRDPDPQIRAEAYLASCRLCPQEAHSLSQEALGDESREVVEQALQQLDRLAETPSQREALLDGLEAGLLRTEALALEPKLDFLRRHRSDFGPGLLPRFGELHGDGARISLARWIVRQGLEASKVEGFFRELMDAPNQWLKCQGFLGLRRLEVSDLNELALGCLYSECHQLQLTALDLLVEREEIGLLEHLSQLLLDDFSDIRVLALEASRRLAPQDAPALASRSFRYGDWQVRQKALEVLRDCGTPEELPVVVEGLGDLDADVSKAALEAAWQLDPDNQRGWLHESLEQFNWQLRRDLLGQLGQRKPQGAFELAMSALDDEDADVRIAAIDAAFALAPQDAARLFARADQDPHWEHRYAVAKGLAACEEPSLRPLLQRLASDEVYEVQHIAKAGLLRIAPKAQQLHECLEALLHDAGEVHKAAREILLQWEAPEQVARYIEARFESLEGSYCHGVLSVLAEGFGGGEVAAEDLSLAGFFQRIPHVKDADGRASMTAYLASATDEEAPQELLLQLWKDPASQVRGAAFWVLRCRWPLEAVKWTRQAFEDPCPELRKQAIELFVEGDARELREELMAVLEGEAHQLHLQACNALVRWFPEERLLWARLAALSPDWEAAEAAALLYAELDSCEAEDLAHIERLFGIEESGPAPLTRPAAFLAALEHLPQKRAEYALEMLNYLDEEQYLLAMEVLEQETPDDALLDKAIARSQHIGAEHQARAILDLVAKHAPQRLPEALEAIDCIGDEELREGYFKRCLEGEGMSTQALRQMMEHSPSIELRKRAFARLSQQLPGERLQLMLMLLQDFSWEIRVEGIEQLQAEKELDPSLVTELLPLMRDCDHDVRYASLGLLARFKDIRVFGELLGCLDDEDERVRHLAQSMLQKGELPVLKRFRGPSSKRPIWVQMREQIEEINRWATKIGGELLDRPVLVLQPGHQPPQEANSSSQLLSIVVPDTPITHHLDHGEEIMRGLALHELGHYLYNEGSRGYKTMSGIARSEGVQEIYDLLCHERIERNLRSRRQEWAPLLDHLASYAFSSNVYRVPLEQYAALLEADVHEVQSQIGLGQLPGQLLPAGAHRPKPVVSLRDRDMIKLPGALPPLMAFLWCLRCGVEARLHPNPAVAEAIALLPGNLKSLPHSKLLQLARDLSRLLGTSEAHKQQFQQMMDRIHGRPQQSTCNSQDGHQGGQEAQEGGQGKPRRSGLGSMMKRHLRRLQPLGAPKWMDPDGGASRPRNFASRPRRRQVLYQRPPTPRHKNPGGQAINLGKERDFDLLPHEKYLEFDAQGQSQLLAPVRKHVRRLRMYFERLGRTDLDEYANRRGSRLDIPQARRMLFTHTPNLLVHSHEELQADLYLGILIDRSGSMSGEKMNTAKTFGALVAESARGIRGIEGHVSAFDDDTFHYLGDFQRSAISGLEAGGGNNDAGGLYRAAQMALHSRKKNRLLVMISDGHPTECSFDALKHFVARLDREYGIRCAQVAVESLQEIAFPHYVDLSQYPFQEAVSRFGNLLIRLTSSWR